MRVSDLKSDKKELTFDYEFGDGSTEAIKLTYDRHRLTPAATAAMEDKERSRELIESLVEIIESWDVLADDGVPLPITVDNLMPLPWPFLNACMRAVVEDQAPKARTKERSDGSFSRKAR